MSEIKVDTLTGKTTANDITVTVGATATQSLEQGLAKAWFNANCNATTYVNRDSFNISSILEATGGDFRESYTSNMDNTNYSVTTSYDLHNIYGGSNGGLQAEEFLTASADYRAWYGTAGNSRDTDICCGQIMGDLA